MQDGNIDTKLKPTKPILIYLNLQIQASTKFFFASLPTRCHYTGKCKLQEGSSLDMVAQTKVLRKKKKA
jgi:hypothetical protein